MRGDDFDKITYQIQQTTKRLADEWLKLADVPLPGENIQYARRRLRTVGIRVDDLTTKVASVGGHAARNGCAPGRVDRLTSELIENRLSVLDLQRAYSVLHEASELERRLGELSMPPQEGTADSPAVSQHHLSQVWPLAVGLQAQLDELCVRASRACVPARFFTWAGSARQRLEAVTAHITRLKDGTLVDC
ncbi:hypothetical protein AB0D30_30880 [Streptomyces sp. NPDC048409]|uniref:hypothetical protein n=1 Tax=Streptomyces sp. NPDC048409 TaxID=3154723 RepID=UPI00344A0E6A